MLRVVAGRRVVDLVLPLFRALWSRLSDPEDGRVDGLDDPVDGRVDGLVEGVEGRVEGLVEGVVGRVDGRVEGVVGRVDGWDGRVVGRVLSPEDGVPPFGVHPPLSLLSHEPLSFLLKTLPWRSV